MLSLSSIPAQGSGGVQGPSQDIQRADRGAPDVEGHSSEELSSGCLRSRGSSAGGGERLFRHRLHFHHRAAGTLKKKVVVVFVVAGVGADVGSVVVIAVIVVGVGVVLVVDFDDGCQAGVDNNQGATTISFASSRTTRPA